ncbi:autotransporter-associated beta strand repeat-containing protein [Prosthecobacter sp.]|uniref:autotransporter-associated beta strand repeat-containing protein n=1 Tax=Prosthecobacter sp. TaxID=1965333 RepID=UPI003783781C
MNHSSLFTSWLRRYAKRPVTAVLIALLPLCTSQVKGATFYWDSDASAAGNATTGAGLGGSGAWDTTSTNWWNLTSDVLWPNATAPYDTAIFTGAGGTVTLGGVINVGSLLFKTDGFSLTGDTLNLGGPATIYVQGYKRTTIDSLITGANGLAKTGDGSLVLSNNSNSFSGDISVQQGQLVITNGSQLGTGTTAISITGVAQTGNPGFSGGALVLQGTSSSISAPGITLNREVSMSGRGPGVVNNSGGLVSIGYNDLAGGLTLGSAAGENRAWASYGSTTVSGGIYLGITGQGQILQGNGNWIISGIVSGSENSADRFIKTGQLIGTTLWLQNAGNNFTDALRVDSGTVRVQVNSALGQNRGTGQVDLNNGTLEIRTDAPAGFASRTVRIRNNTTGTIFVDHDITGPLGNGTSLINQTLGLGGLIRDAGGNIANITVNGRNGYNTTITVATPTAADYRGITLTNNSSGVLTLTGGDVWNANNAAASTFTVTGNSDTVITGSILAATADNMVTKAGTGYFTYGGSAGTYLGSTNITGTMAITTFGALNAATVSPIQLNSGALDYRGTGATTGKYLNLSGTTGFGIVLANQASGSPLVFTAPIVEAGGNGNKTFFLGGDSAASIINEIGGLIANSTGSTTSVSKVGSGTWLYDPAASGYLAGGSAAWASGGGAGSDTFVVSGATGTIAVGQAVSGGNIPAGSVVTAVNGNTITISNLIGTALAASTITFGATTNFVGNVTVSGGTLQVRPTSAAGNGSDVINNTSQVVFGTDALRNNQWAGGTFEYQGSATAGALVEQVGALTPTAGAGYVKTTANGGTPTLNFASLGTRGAGATLNFNPDAGTSITFTAAAGSSGLFGGWATYGSAGTDFAASVSAGGAVTALTGQAELPTSGGVAGTNYQSTGTPLSNLSAESINSLKIVNAQTITLGGALTIASGGILFDNSNGAATIQNNGTAANTLGASASEVIIITNGTAAGNLLTNDTGNALTVSAVISGGAGSLTKAGSGVLILSGANAYTGTTTINEGGIQLSGSGTIGGTNASLTMRQNTVLDLNGVSIGSVSANGLNVLNGAGTIINNAASGTAVLRVGNSNGSGLFSGLITDGTSAAISLSKAGTGSLTLTGVNSFSGGVSILGGTLVVTSLADGGVASSIGNSSNDAANLVFSGGTLQYTGSNASIYQVTQTPSVSIDRLFTLAANGTIDSSGQFGNSVLATGNRNDAALIFRNQGDIAFSGAATARLLTLQGNSLGDNELDVHLIDNGAGALSFTKGGSGLWILNPLTSNSYTGTTTVSGGVLRVASSDYAVQGLSASSPLVINGGVLETSGTFSRTLGAAVAGNGTTVAITGGASGFSAATSDRLVVNIGGGGLTWGSSTFNPSSLVLGSSTALGETEITNDIAIGSATRTITVNNNGNTGTMVTAGILSGVISGAGTGGAALIKNGNGVLILGSNNIYTGSTRVDAGNLIVTSIGTGASSSLGASGAFIYNGSGGGDLSALSYVGSGETANRDLTFQGGNFNGNRVYRLDSSGSGALVWNTGVFTNTTRGDTVARVVTLEFRGSNTDNNQFNLVLTNSTNATFGNVLGISKSDGGVWSMNPPTPNTFTGSISVVGGLLGLTSNAIGSASSILLNNGGIFASGGPLTTSTVVQGNNSTGEVTGAYDITLNGGVQKTAGNNQWTLSNNIDAGSLLTINGNFSNLEAGGTAATQTISIRGTGSTIWNGAITENAAAGGKIAWDIRIDDNAYFKFEGSTANTYTGSTLLGQGTLILSKASGVAQFGSSSQFIFDGGVLTADLPLTGADKITTKLTLAGDQATITGTNSIEFSGVVENNGSNRLLRNELSGGATLTLSGTINLSNDNTGRTLTLRGSGSTLISGTVANGGTAAGNLSYSGLDTLTLTHANTATGALTVNRNNIVLSGAGTWAGSITLSAGGVITLDNSAGSVNRLADAGAVTGQGGTLNIIGAAGGTTETTGVLTINSVQTFITTSGGNVGLTFASVNFANSGSTLNLSGISSLGTNNTVKFTTAPSGGTVVYNNVIPRILLGTDFAKYDATNGVVALASADYNLGNNLNTAAATDTIGLTASSTLVASRTINAIKIDGTGLSVGGNTGVRLTVTSGGLINTGGDNSLDVPSITFVGNTPVIQVQSGTTLTVNSTLIGTANFVKVQSGTLAFNTPSFVTGTHNLLNGTTKLIANGLNTFFPGQLLNINQGATLDLNGGVQYMAQLSDPGILPDTGGVITSSIGTGTIVSNMNPGSATLATSINGSVNLARVGGNTLTLESANSYSGFTVMMGGTLQLQDEATILNTTSIELNAAALLLNNNSSLQRALYDRVGDSTAITLRDGTVSFTGKVSDPSYEVFGALTSAQGANTITANVGGTGTAGALDSADITFASLTRSAGTTINFTGSALGQQGNNAAIFFTTPLTTNANGALGAWAIANSTDYAAYNSGTGIGIVGQGGYTGYSGAFASGEITDIPASAANVTLLPSDTTTTGMLKISGAFTNDITFTDSSSILNLEQGGLLRSNNNNATSIGTLALRGTLTAGGTESSGTRELVIYSAATGTANFTGGVTTAGSSTITMTSTVGLSPGMTVTNANLPAGTYIVSVVDGTTVTVSQNASASTTGQTFVGGAANVIINAVIADNGSGNSVQLIKSGAGILNLSANNTYTGGTIIDQGTVNLIGTGVVIPAGGLLINSSTLVLNTNAGQIDPSNTVTLRRSSTLTLAGSNTLNALVFDNNGGTTNPVVTIGAGNTLTLTSNTPVSVANSNALTVPTINLGTLALAPGANTFDVQAPTVNGVLYSTINSALNITSVVTGTTSSIVKNGTGIMQLSGQSTFNGLTINNGGILISGNSTGTIGGAGIASGPLGLGSVTAASGTTLLVDGSRTIANPISFAGTPTFDSTATTVWTLTLNGALSGAGLGSTPTIQINNPSLTVALLGALGPMTSISKTGPGILIFNATNYTGDFNASALGNPSSVSLLTDGDGTGKVQTLLTTSNVTFDPGIVPTIVVGRAGGTLPFNLAVNKIIAPASVSSLGGGVTITNNNGYGLQVSDNIAFTGTPTISVANASASNVIQGLYLTGNLTGTGFNKSGGGTLVIDNAAPSGNTFTGNINITQGVVSVAAAGELGNAANLIVLNPSTGTSAFRATGTFATSQVIQLANTANIRAIEVSYGNTLTLNSAFNLNGATGATAALNKQDLGTLIINASNPGWSGQINITEGAILINNPALVSPLGTGTINASTSNVIGSALQLAGGVTISNPLTLQGTNNVLNAGINFQGVIDNVSGTNTYAGAITQGFDSTIGARAGSTLNITGGIIGAAHRLQFNAEGDINVTTVSLTNLLWGMDKYGAGTLTFSVPIVPPTSSNGILVHAGTLALNGTATMTATTGGNIVYNGAILRLDNSGTNTDNRLVGKSLLLQGGQLNFISKNSTETAGAFTSDQGSNVINISGTGTAALTFATLTSNAGSTLDVTGTFGTATNFLKFTTAPGLTPATTGILNRVTVNGSELATYSASLGVIAFTGYSAATNILSAATTQTFKATTSTLNSLTGNQTLNALTINNTAAVGGLGGNPPATLTITSGTILANGTGGAFLNVPVVAFGGEAIIHVQSGQSLTVNSGMSGSAGMSKDLPGELDINSQQFIIGTTYINEGTVKLTTSGITNPLLYNQGMALNYGGTFDLNGSNQFVAGLSSATAGGGNGIAGGTVINSGSTQSTFTINGNTNFAGVISGNIYLNKTGTGALNLQSAQTYTGDTFISGGTVTLNDNGALLNTNSITINYGGLSLSNGNLYNVDDRVKDTATITMAGASLTYGGRQQMNTSETLGAVSIIEGFNFISAANGGTNVNSSVLTLASLTRAVGSTATLRFNGNGNSVGAIGSTPNIIITAAPTLTNNILGPWAIVDREWASYDATYGIGQLNQNGFAGYAGSSLNSGPLDTDNVRFTTTGTTTLLGDTTVYTLNFASQNAATILDLGGFTLAMKGGGLLLAQGTDNVDFTIRNGSLTSGAVNVASDFYITHANFGGTNRTITLNAPVVDNGTGAVRLIFTSGQIEGAGVGNTTINAVNTNTGGTILNSGNIILGATGALGTGGLTVNQAILTQTAGSVIPASNVLTLGGGSLVNLASQANTLAGITVNNLGGAAPTVNPTGVLTLTGGINVSTVNAGNAAVIGTGTLDLNGAGSYAVNLGAAIINGVNVAPWQASLNINALIQNGGITKTGDGLLQLSSNLSTFSGGVNVMAGGLIIGASSVGSNLGDTLTSGPLGTGAVTMAANTSLLASGAFSVINDFTFMGDTVFNGTNSLTLNGNTTLPSTWNVTVTAPQMTVSIGNVINSLSTDVVNKSGLGTLILGNYNGTINIAGGLIFLADGNTLGTVETISLGGNVTLTADTAVTVNRSGGAPFARNKVLQKVNLTNNGSILAINNLSGYGLEFTGSISLTGASHFSVTNATASNVVQGLILSGVVSDTGGYSLVKSGAGTLVLDNSGNTFGGPGATIDVLNGVLSVSSDGALGNAANTITLEIDSQTGTGFRATSSFSTNRTFLLNAANNAFEVTQNNTLTLNTPFSLSAVTNTLNKNDSGVLAINASNSTMTGAININGGAIMVMQNNALGSGSITVTNAIGSALQLSGGVTVSNPITLTTNSQTSGINSGGSIQSVSGINTYSGLITQTSGNAATYGADAGATLNITGNIVTGNTSSFFAGTGGLINLTGVIGNGAGGSALTKIGAGTLAVIGNQTGYTGAITINAGTLSVSGSGVKLGATGAIAVNPTGTLFIDDTGTATANRLGGRALTLSGGTFSYLGNGVTSTESIGALTLNRPANTIISNSNGGSVTLTFASLASNIVTGDSSVNFIGTGTALGSATNKIIFTAAPTLTNSIIQRATVNGSDFATYGANGIAAFTAYNAGSTTNINSVTATTGTVDVNSVMTTRDLTASRTFNALRFSDPSGASVGSTGAAFITGGTTPAALTLAAGAILATGGGNNVLGVPVLNNAAVQNFYAVDSGTTLNITSAIVGTVGWVKAGSGTLIFSPPASPIAGRGASTITGNASIEAGTVILNGGNNTLVANQNLLVGPGATLDLNGNSQFIQILFSDTGGVEGAGGTITGGALSGSTLAINQDNNARNWAGYLTGAMSFLRSGQNTLTMYSNNDYTGLTIIGGGATTLKDGGQLSGTSDIQINYATLNIDNTGSKELLDRVNDAAPISLRGGTLAFFGRAQSASTETVGNVTLVKGASFINSTIGGTGVNSADLTLTSLTRAVGGGTVNFTAATGGQVGSSSRILIPTINGISTDAVGGGLTNGIIGGWAVIGTSDFATYIPGLGVAAMGANGALPYSNTTSIPNTLNIAGVTDNISINVAVTGNVLTVTNDTTINSLRIGNIAAQTIDIAAGKTLTLSSGGLLFFSTASQTIGSAVNKGSLTTSGPELFIYTQGTGPQIINSSITGSGVMLVKSGANTLTLNGTNTYDGGTTINQGALTLGLSSSIPLAANPLNGLILNGSTFTEVAAGQIASGNIVTLNGSSTLNLVGSNTLAGLVFNDEGGGVTAIQVVSNQNGGILTLNGNIVSTSTNPASTPTIAGRVDFGTSNRTLNISAARFNGQELAALLADFILQGVVGSSGGITKTGDGVLQLNGQALYTGATTVSNGRLQIGVANGGSRYSDVTLASGTGLNLNSFSTTLGSLAGSGYVMNSSATTTAVTLAVGYSGASSTFSGTFLRFNDATPANLNLLKIGTGTMTFDTDGSLSTITGSLTVNLGGVTFKDNGTSAFPFATLTVNEGGTLTLDNTGSANNDARLRNGNVTLNGGILNYLGADATASAETGTGVLTLGSGESNVDLTAGAGGTAFLKFGSLSQGTGSTSIISGTGLGTTTKLLFNTAPGLTNNILPRVAVGTDFATYNATNGIIAFTAYTSLTDVNTAVAANTVKIESTTTTRNITLARSLNALDIIDSDVTLGSTGLLLPTQGLTVGSGAVMVNGDNATISTPVLALGAEGIFRVNGTSLNVTSSITGSGGITKTGVGSMTLSALQSYTGTTTVNQGTLTLAGGTNTILVVPTGSIPAVSNLQINGGVFDLNGNNQIVGAIFSSNTLADIPGEITNSSTTTAVTLTAAMAASSTFGGTISGNLSFVRSGNTTLTLVDAQTYTGSTTIRGGALTLQDAATLATSAITLNFATMSLTNAGLNATPNPVRFAATVPVTMQGSVLSITPGGSVDNTTTINSVTILGGGANTITPNGVTGGTNTITIGNLILPAGTGTTLHFNTDPGQPTTSGAQVFLTQINGAAPVNNTFLGANVIINNGEYGVYNTIQGVIRLGGTAVAGNTVPAYAAGLASGNNLPTNISNTGADVAISANTTIGALRLTGAATRNITFTLGTEVLNLALGGLLRDNNNNAVNIGTTALRGILTSGGTATTGVTELVDWHNQNTVTINSIIADNGLGNLTRYVKSGPAGTTLTAANTYTGGTVVDQGTLTINATAGAGTVVIPAGGITLNNANLTMSTNQGQIDASNAVTINGGGVLTLVGTNALSSVTFSNPGSSATPTVAVGTLLTLTSATPITVTNDTMNFTPTISGTELNLVDGATISTSGLSADDLIISAKISTSGSTTPLVKTGAGSIVLSSNTSAFANGFNLSQGTLIFANSSAGTPPAVTAGPVGTGTLTLGNGVAILSDGTARNIGNAVSVTQDFTFGTLDTVSARANAGNSLTLSGIVTLASGAHKITVNGLLMTGTITGKLTGGTDLTKDGAGALVLSSTANDYGGSTTVSAGLLQLGAAGVIPDASALIVASGAYFDINGKNEAIGSLAGAGVVTNIGAAATLTVGNDGTDTAFSGTVTNQANALNLVKTGAGKQTLSGANNYTGTTAVNVGILSIGSNTALGTTTAGTTVASGASLELQGGITIGAEALSIAGTGSATNGALRNLSGANTYGGTVTLTADATIQSDAGTLTLSAANAVTGAARNLAVTGSGDTVISGTITTTTGTLSKSGTGALTLSGANTFTGSTTVSDGALNLNTTGSNALAGNLIVSGGVASLQQSNQIADASTVTVSGGEFAVGTSSESVAGVQLVSGTISGTSGVLTSTTAYDMQSGTASAILSGSVDLNKTTTGTVILSGANTYTGKTSVTGGTLSISADTNLGAVPGAVTPDQLTLDGGTLQTTADLTVAANRGVTIGAAGGTFQTAVGTTATVSSVVTGAGILTKEGAGTLVFTATNTNVGLTNVNAGTLSGTGVGGALTVNSGGTIDPGVGGAGLLTVGGNLTVNAGGTLLMQLGGATLNDADSISGHEGSLTSISPSIISGWESANTLSLHDRIFSNDASAPVINGTLKIDSNLLNGYAPSYGDVFDLLDWTTLSSSITGTTQFDFSGVNLGGLSFNTDLFASNGILVVVPEPGRCLLLLLGLASLFFRRRRRYSR